MTPVLIRTRAARASSSHIPTNVGAGAEALIGARGDFRRAQAVFEQSSVPMVMTDSRRQYVEANRPARLWYRRSVHDMRTHAIDDLAPADRMEVIERDWGRLIETGSLAGSYLATRPDGSRVSVAYFALANLLPGLHAIVFAPADWPEHELSAIEADRPDASAAMTPREIEVLALAADGLSGPELANQLGLSGTTVNTHFKNIYEKLGVRNRAAAVAKGMRLGMID
jgi:DNA-binding CsgD family transcriptional regulator